MNNEKVVITKNQVRLVVFLQKIIERLYGEDSPAYLLHSEVEITETPYDSVCSVVSIKGKFSISVSRAIMVELQLETRRGTAQGRPWNEGTTDISLSHADGRVKARLSHSLGEPIFVYGDITEFQSAIGAHQVSK